MGLVTNCLFPRKEYKNVLGWPLTSILGSAAPKIVSHSVCGTLGGFLSIKPILNNNIETSD